MRGDTANHCFDWLLSQPQSGIVPWPRFARISLPALQSDDLGGALTYAALKIRPRLAKYLRSKEAKPLRLSPVGPRQSLSMLAAGPSSGPGLRSMYTSGCANSSAFETRYRPPGELQRSSGLLAFLWRSFACGIGPKCSGMAVELIRANSRGQATILDPFTAILVILGPTPYLRLQHLSCVNSRHLSCLSNRHLACLSNTCLSAPDCTHICLVSA